MTAQQKALIDGTIVKVSDHQARSLRRDLGVKVRRGRIADARHVSAHIMGSVLWFHKLAPTAREGYARVRAVGPEIVGAWRGWSRVPSNNLGMLYDSCGYAVVGGVDYVRTVNYKAFDDGDVRLLFRPDGTVAVEVEDSWELIDDEFCAAWDVEKDMGAPLATSFAWTISQLRRNRFGTRHIEQKLIEAAQRVN